MRYPDWLERLNVFIEARRNTPHAWGTNDCCLFVADAILAITGTDPAQRWRGTYSDEVGAQAILAEHGGLAGLVGSVLGPAYGPLCARRGDVVAVETPYGEAIGICLGVKAVFVTDSHLRFRPLSDCIRAWHV